MTSRDQLIRVAHRNLNEEYEFGEASWPLRMCDADECREIAAAHKCTETGCVFVAAVTLVADEIDASEWVNAGELVAYEMGCMGSQSSCPRCDMAQAISMLGSAGEWIRTHYPADHEAQLTEDEAKLVDAAVAWLAEDAVAQCLEDGD